MLQSYLAETLLLAATGSEKARSEGLIYPVLVEVRRYLKRQVAVFSGEDFTVDEARGLSGMVDFLLSRSPLGSLVWMMQDGGTRDRRLSNLWASLISLLRKGGSDVRLG